MRTTLDPNRVLPYVNSLPRNASLRVVANDNWGNGTLTYEGAVTRVCPAPNAEDALVFLSKSHFGFYLRNVRSLSVKTPTTGFRPVPPELPRDFDASISEPASAGPSPKPSGIGWLRRLKAQLFKTPINTAETNTNAAESGTSPAP